MNLKILAATAIALMAPTYEASAQCISCAMYPDRDSLNGGAITPAGRSGLVGAYGAASASNRPSEALASVRDQNLGVSDEQVARLKKRTRPHGSPQ